MTKHNKPDNKCPEHSEHKLLNLRPCMCGDFKNILRTSTWSPTNSPWSCFHDVRPNMDVGRCQINPWYITIVDTQNTNGTHISENNTAHTNTRTHAHTLTHDTKSAGSGSMLWSRRAVPGGPLENCMWTFGIYVQGGHLSQVQPYLKRSSQ
jgi:hypothetical protein